jgi:diguanylate cyclase (GGDEF)-like protein
VTARSRHELEASSLKSRNDALHDALTGLPNRTLLDERLEHALLRSERSGLAPAILFLDLDGFKSVNDLHGHATGDELLIAVGRRVAAMLRPSDTVARLSGDEFVVLCEDLPSDAALDAIAVRVGAGLAAEFVLSTKKVAITASIGTATAVPGVATVDGLLHEADVAMYTAKRNGGSGHQNLAAHYGPQADRSIDLEVAQSD